jgi:nucleoid DNA-binding protein
MNRADLSEVVARSLGDCSKAAADRAIGAVLAGILRGLKKEQKVTLVGFGTFVVKKRKAREGRNPRNGEPIRIAASRTVGFKPGLDLKARV